MPQYTSVDFQFDVPVILAYPDLFVARAYEDRKTRAMGKPAYGTQCLLRPDHAELQAMRDGLRQAALNEWGTTDQVIFPVELGDAVAAKAATGDQPKDRSAFRGFVVLKSSTPEANPPGLAAVHNGTLVDVPADAIARKAFERYFYGGVEAMASFRFKATDFGGTRRVKAYLQTVTSLSRGDKVPAFNAGGTKSASAVSGDAVRGHISNVMPAAAATGASAMG
jgi:hypothetical protein